MSIDACKGVTDLHHHHYQRIYKTKTANTHLGYVLLAYIGKTGTEKQDVELGRLL